MDELPKPEVKPAPAPRPDTGLLLVLTLGMLAGLGACFFALSHAEQGVDLASQFNGALPVLAVFYVNWAAYAFTLPPLIWLAALAVTRLGRVQLPIGKMLVALLFGFALLWPAGAFMAFQKAYDPPRSTPVRSR